MDLLSNNGEAIEQARPTGKPIWLMDRSAPLIDRHVKTTGVDG
ncbi:hypothetical protein [Shinella sp. G-2]